MQGRRGRDHGTLREPRLSNARLHGREELPGAILPDARRLFCREADLTSLTVMMRGQSSCPPYLIRVSRFGFGKISFKSLPVGRIIYAVHVSHCIVLRRGSLAATGLTALALKGSYDPGLSLAGGCHSLRSTGNIATILERENQAADFERRAGCGGLEQRHGNCRDLRRPHRAE